MKHLLALALCATAFSMQAQQIVVSKENRTIAVTTTADATAEADTVSVQIGYLVYGPDQDTAYALGSKTSNAIADALKAAKVPADAVQSDAQGIAPVQQFNNQSWTPAEKAARKFQVTQSWTVKTAANDGAKVLDIAVKAGANQSGGMTWSVADQDALQAKAARLALDRARQIASQMASGLNATLGPLVYASNEAPSREPKARAFDRLEAFAPAPKPAPLSISAQKVTASATVYAVFSIQ